MLGGNLLFSELRYVSVQTDFTLLENKQTWSDILNTFAALNVHFTTLRLMWIATLHNDNCHNYSILLLNCLVFYVMGEECCSSCFFLIGFKRQDQRCVYGKYEP